MILLEQEIASAMKFLIDAAGCPNPYYYNVPEDFFTPAVFFPQPEISTRGDTLSTFALEFRWYVKFFDKDSQSAQHTAIRVLAALQEKRCVVPLIDENGSLTGRGFRMKDPSMRLVDEGAVQINLSWDSPRPYHSPPKQIISINHVNLMLRSAYDGAVSQIGG